MEKKIPIAELFFSLQGEGETVGKPSLFVRVANCNLACGHTKLPSKWECDTWEIMRKPSFLLTPFELAEKIKNILFTFSSDDTFEGTKETFYVRNKGTWQIVFTGGEPLLYANELTQTLSYLQSFLSFFPTYEIETNGTINTPLHAVRDFLSRARRINISPKLQGSGISLDDRFKPDIWKEWAALYPGIRFKFVIADEEDYQELKERYFPVLKTFFYYSFDLWSKPNWKEKIFLMPATNKDSSVERFVWELCVKEGFKMSPRYHINVWGLRAGV